MTKSKSFEDREEASERTRGKTHEEPRRHEVAGTGDVRPHAALHDGLKTHRDGVPGTFVGAAAGCPASSRVRNAVVDPVHQQCLGASQIPVTGSQLSASGSSCLSYLACLLALVFPATIQTKFCQTRGGLSSFPSTHKQNKMFLNTNSKGQLALVSPRVVAVSLSGSRGAGNVPRPFRGRLRLFFFGAPTLGHTAPC